MADSPNANGRETDRPARAISRTRKLRLAVERTDRVLTVLSSYNAFTAKLLELTGIEVVNVGTSNVGGAYTGLPDVGVVSMTEMVNIAGYIARGVSIPVILDGDTGHGGVMAVRRLVEECIRAGLAGLRLDDQPLEGKRRSQMAGIEVASRELAIARYRAAVDMRDEIDPDFVIMAQCYARDAANGGLDEAIARLNLYREVGGVDWVQLESPHSLDEVKQTRAQVPGLLTVMQGRMPRPLSIDEHRELGFNVAWYTFMVPAVMRAIAWEFAHSFATDGLDAWTKFKAAHPDNPFLDARRRR